MHAPGPARRCSSDWGYCALRSVALKVKESAGRKRIDRDEMYAYTRCFLRGGCISALAVVDLNPGCFPVSDVRRCSLSLGRSKRVPSASEAILIG